MNTGDKIRVLVRKRPLSKKQINRNQIDIVSILDNQTVIVKEQKVKVDLTPYIDEYKFNFDGAYDQNATNEQIYLTSIKQLVNYAFDGAKVSCFAYGQTGSGKTYTMLGSIQNNIKGLYLLSSIDIFQLKKQKIFQFLDIWVSFYQIYCGKLYDLLNQKNILFARQDAKNNVNIVGLSQCKIYNTNNLMQIIQYGTSIRVTSQNGTNNDSSRSHAILQIILKNTKNNKLHGKISFIDLAGSQRAADHSDQLEKQTRIDGAEINKSLLALKQCIRALDQNKNHTPFRGSKLTMVLKDSFTGYCRTIMIGNISPNSISCQNTLNTLKYADRVKELKKPNKQNYIQIQKIDQLSRQLMLPRMNIKSIVGGGGGLKNKIIQLSQEENNNNNRMYQQQQCKYNSIHKSKTSHNVRKYNKNNNNNNSNNNNNNHHNNHNKSPKNNNNYRNLILGNGKLSPNTDKRQYSISFTNNNNNNNNNLNNKMNNSNLNNKINNNNNTPKISLNNNKNIQNQFQQKRIIQKQSVTLGLGMIQQQQQQPILIQTQLLNLSQKHDQYVQLILESEQYLILEHQKYINQTIELTKQQMLLRDQADKIGSNIQDYLDNLDQILSTKMQSIIQIRKQISTIKKYLKESKNIEEQYLKYNQINYQHENNLLDQDDQLFIQ